MADTKISALSGATTPLAGTEVLPVVQNNTTKQVSIANLTAGRAVSSSSLSSTTDSSFATTSGKVGVGLSTPNYKLHVYNNAPTGYGLQVAKDGSANPGDYTGILMCTGDGNTAAPSYNGAIRLEQTAGAPGYYNPDLVFYVQNTNTYLLADMAEKGRLTGSGDYKLKSGNFVPSTAAKGINFTANTPAVGMTSQLLNWYEEGAWDCSLYDNTGKVDNLAGQGQYVRVGNIVHVSARIFNGTNFTATGPVYMILPFPAGANTAMAASPVVYSVDAGNCLGVYISDGSANANLSTASSNMLGSNVTTGATFTNAKRLYFSLTYSAA